MRTQGFTQQQHHRAILGWFRREEHAKKPSLLNLQHHSPAGIRGGSMQTLSYRTTFTFIITAALMLAAHAEYIDAKGIRRVGSPPPQSKQVLLPAKPTDREVRSAIVQAIEKKWMDSQYADEAQAKLAEICFEAREATEDFVVCDSSNITIGVNPVGLPHKIVLIGIPKDPIFTGKYYRTWAVPTGKAYRANSNAFEKWLCISILENH